MRNSYSLNEEGKQKEPITQSIRNRRERGSRFKMMFYVIGSEESKSGSASYNSCRQNQRRGGADRHFRYTDTVSDHSDYLSICLNISIFSCPQRSTRYTNILQTKSEFIKIGKQRYHDSVTIQKELLSKLGRS